VATTFPNVEPQVSRPKVLVVDPDCEYVDRLSAELRNRGYAPLVASTYQRGRELWIVERPQMLIADVRLGQFNGLQLLLRARADRPDLSAIITTSAPDKMLEAEARRFGAQFVIKPARPEELAARLERRKSQRRRVVTDGFTPDRRAAERRASMRAAVRQTNVSVQNSMQALNGEHPAD
jgi:two-component system, response regulator RegA